MSLPFETARAGRTPSPEAGSAPSRRPVIGLTTYEAEAAWGVWHHRAVVLHMDYVRALTAVGAIPVLLPPVPGIAAAVARLDGLVITGGPDVDPATYGQAPQADTVWQVRRDDAELALFAAAADVGLPILGICRGLQVINVARGGTLLQHLPDVVGGVGHSPGAAEFGTTQVSVSAGSMLARALGRSHVEGRCHHHQAVETLGAGLQIVARASADGTVEAVEDPSRRFLLAVQWHPEVGDETDLFQALVAACAPSRL
jgi:putative glutamine amidotransferase